MSGTEPWSWRATSLALHIGTSLGVYELAGLLVTAAPGAPVLAGVLFAVHPIASELVNYTWSRSSLMVAFFSIWGLVLWLQGRWGGSAACFVLGLLSKAEAVSFVLVCGWQMVCWPAADDDAGRPRWKALLDLVGITVIYLVLRAVMATQWLRLVTQSGVSAWQYALTQPRVWWIYVSQLVAPFQLVIDDQSYPLSSGLGDCRFIWAVIGWAVVALVVTDRRFPARVPFLVGCFGLYLLPHSSIFPLAEPMNGHRSYLAAAGLFILAAELILRACQSWRWLASLALVAGLSLCTYTQNETWVNDLVLWRHAAYYAPRSARARMNYGEALMENGYMPEARLELEEAVRLAPEYDLARTNLKICMAYQAAHPTPGR